jgi:glycosyl transferase family 25
VYQWRPKDVARLYPRPFSPLLYRAGYHNCTHAYALTRGAAQKLIASQTPVHYCSDSVLTHHVLRKRLEAYSVRRQLFTQLDFVSGHQAATSYINSD